MGLLDAPAYSRAQADSLLGAINSRLPGRRRNTIAALGDSLLNNGGTSLAVVKLASTANIGDTTISVNAPMGGTQTGASADSQMSSDFVAGTLLQLGTEFVYTSAAPTVVTSGTLYTIGLTSALTVIHPAGATLVTRPAVQASNSPQPAFWAHLFSQGVLRYAGTYGRGGWRASELIATYLPLVIQAKPGFCVVMGGRNRETAIDATLSNVVTMWDQLLAAGIIPIGQTVPPLSGTTTTTQQDDELLNTRLRVSASRRGIPFYDFYSDVVNPATADWSSTYLGDGTHPNTAGRQMQGQKLWNTISPLVGSTTKPAVLTNARKNTAVYVFPPAQTNAKMLTTGGTLNASTSALMPLLWKTTVAGSLGTMSVQAAPRGNGNSVKLARNAAQSTQADILPTTTVSYATLIPGHVYRATCELKTTGLTASFAADSNSSVTVGITNTGAGGTTSFGVFGPISLDVDGTFAWDFQCTATSPTAGYLHILVKGGASSLAFNVEFWDADIVDLSAMHADRHANDAVINSGTTTLTSATAAFTSADVGKTVNVYGAGASGIPLVATISGYTNATTVTLSAAAGTTVSAAQMTINPAAPNDVTDGISSLVYALT